jgi:hypothetical protein
MIRSTIGSATEFLTVNVAPPFTYVSSSGDTWHRPEADKHSTLA